ncbi:MAG: 2Fe-2S iron-sulfur cluster-binding protein [Mariprofundaceae bacterium]|nr:2Fe-2S iron-sulfur cluster-binding protein [Mariprofundaceae bacterium]
MPNISFEGKTYHCDEDKILLDSLAEHGVNIPFSCRGGACHACLSKITKGTPPPASQMGLRDTLKAQNYFLPCICKPITDMTMAAKVQQPMSYAASVIEKSWLNANTLLLRLSKPAGFRYHAGQFINLMDETGNLIRSYSLASIQSDDFLELHIKHVPDGKMSGWLCDSLKRGDDIAFVEASGNCFYLDNDKEQALLLAGAGTGLAPLYGIAREAIASGHQGKIQLFHGALAKEGLYYEDELKALARQHANFHYTACVLHGQAPEGGLQGSIDQLLKQHAGELKGSRAYLCGDPGLVSSMQQSVFCAGISMQEIYADAFTFTP